MDINLTLLGEMITFAIFIGFTMKYIWPPLTQLMEERREKIAAGLQAAAQGRQALETAQVQAKEQLLNAKTQAAAILEQANQHATHIIEEAKTIARKEGNRLLKMAKSDIEQEYLTAKEQLIKEIGEITLTGVEWILKREIDTKKSKQLLKELSESMHV